MVFFSSHVFAAEPKTTLIIKQDTIEVDGKKAKVFRIVQPDGTWGYRGVKGEHFDAVVKNQSKEPTVVHWHGLIVPNDQDGVPVITQPLIPPGGEYRYYFKLKQAGTYWMHSHHGLQVQQQLSAPLILDDPNDKTNEKQVTVFLSDFSYRKPEEIFKGLRKGMMNHDHGVAMNDMKHGAVPADLNDVDYDAYLTNYRTLQNPELVEVKPGEQVRLRVINGSAATNFFVTTQTLKGEAIAMDGEDIKPLPGSVFQLAVGQRVDIRVKVPDGEGVYPILAQGEGTAMQTGLVLATAKSKPLALSEHATNDVGALNYQQELSVSSLHPLAKKKPAQSLMVNLEGDMMTYVWSINKKPWPNFEPLIVKPNKRIELVFNNKTTMAHPMHLHGHVFEIMEIDGKAIKNGALRDTVLVLPNSTVKVQFDSDNPGNWMMHCHVLYHSESGMMTLLSYEGVKIPHVDSMMI